MTLFWRVCVDKKYSSSFVTEGPLSNGACMLKEKITKIEINKMKPVQCPALGCFLHLND